MAEVSLDIVSEFEGYFKNYNEKELVRDFFNFISEGVADEPFYLTLLKRTKYLTTEERSLYSNNSNMLDIKLYQANKFYSNFDNYYRNIARFNCDETAYLGKDGKPLPTICKATYAGINPVDLSVARKNYMKELGDLEYRAKTREALELVYAKMPRLFLKNCTRSRSKKRIVDIDVDIDENLITDEVRRRCFEYFLLLLKNNVPDSGLDDILLVFTKGGFHILSKTRSFNRYWHTGTITLLAAEAFEGFTKEIKENKNEMCPLPGTLQCGFMVNCVKVKEFARLNEMEI